jgi:hypothetical protein
VSTTSAHVNEAERLLLVAAGDRSALRESEWFGSGEEIFAAAQVRATLAVADELRLSNLIALVSDGIPSVGPGISRQVIYGEIRKGLGLQ